MNNSVLISVHPKWCELIAQGKKTVEVRKTRPKIDVPFKCYLYCTKNKRARALHTYINSGFGRKNFGIVGHWRSGKDVVDVNSHSPAYRYNAYLAEGKVIGEFVCDDISMDVVGYKDGTQTYHALLEGSCLNETELFRYGNWALLYGWHISDLVIYDKPKNLRNFMKSKTPDMSDLCDELCSYCTTTGRGEHRALSYPGGAAFCEGRFCDKAYDTYLNENNFLITRAPQSWCYVGGIYE